jgi:hypothetical protein
VRPVAALLKRFAKGSVIAAFLPLLAATAVLARTWHMFGAQPRYKPRLVWAGLPIFSIAWSSKALRAKGFDTLSIANTRYRTALDSDFDVWLADGSVPTLPGRAVRLLRAVSCFVTLLFTRDVLHAYFNGGVLGKTPLLNWEFRLWKLAGKKLVLFPYGSDAFVYSRLPASEWAEALKADYPRSTENDAAVAWRVDAFTRLADCVVGCLVHTVGLPRVDFWPVLWYPADLSIKPVPPSTSGPIRIAHAPNHRLIKGTQYLIEAVERLRARGCPVELDLIEGVGRDVVYEAFRHADIVVDQLLFGYALTALEGMAFGKPVLSGVSDDPMYEPFRRLSYLDEAPVIPTSSATIEQDLERLIVRRSEWPEIGRRGRSFVERRHSPDATVELMERVYAHIGFVRPARS